MCEPDGSCSLREIVPVTTLSTLAHDSITHGLDKQSDRVSGEARLFPNQLSVHSTDNRPVKRRLSIISRSQ